MLFTDDFLLSVKADPVNGAIQIVKKAREHLEQDEREYSESDHNILMETYALISALINSGLLPVQNEIIEITGEISSDCPRIQQFLTSVNNLCLSHSTQLKMASFESYFKASLGSVFCYEFSQGDLARVQILLSQIRDLITASTALEADHKQRLLRRLEKLQSEVHKRISDLDRFWGLIGDAGVVLGKLGTDAKPIVDRIKEIADIIWQTQSRAEELPRLAGFLAFYKEQRLDKKLIALCDNWRIGLRKRTYSTDSLAPENTALRQPAAPAGQSRRGLKSSNNEHWSSQALSKIEGR